MLGRRCFNLMRPLRMSHRPDHSSAQASDQTQQRQQQHQQNLPPKIDKFTGLSTSHDPFEPAYIDQLKPKVGFYKLLNIELKGYDFVVLEKYQHYLHKRIVKMDINVVDTWSVPHQELQLETLGFRSTAIDSTCIIKIYERNIQIKDALVTKLPILIDLIHLTLPPGVSFGICRHSEECETRRYFRDSVLEKLKDELQELKDTPLIGD